MSVRSPFDEAVAFFDLFLRSDWASCHVRGGAIEMFVAREAGQPNPMCTVAADADEAIAVRADEAVPLTAPHLATLVELAAIGGRIAVGERYARIALLDETLDVWSDRDGTIVAHVAMPGALVEFGQPLVLLG